MSGAATVVIPYLVARSKERSSKVGSMVALLGFGLLWVCSESTPLGLGALLHVGFGVGLLLVMAGAVAFLTPERAKKK